MLVVQLVLLGALMHDAAASQMETSTAGIVVNGSSARPHGNVILTVWPAPVGHRQPRAADVPAEGQRKSGFDRQLERLNHALDGRLRICRDC